MKSKDLFRLGGQRWREMSSKEKTPYVREAKLAKQLSQQNNKSDHTNKINDNDSTKKSGNQKDQKKKEQEVRLLINFLSYFTEQSYICEYFRYISLS
jgi:hypothetical protein